ncbi:MAG: hypothetical protein KJ621_04285 [Proteobacteria bacterium]|nr:hypothetical protein [Pseudomonadota bacterium]MBU1742526.1 hypothetical protein [Pseudomonadota bacterium]
MTRGHRDIVAALLALVLCPAAVAVGAQPPDRPRSFTHEGRAPLARVQAKPLAGQDLQRRLWAAGQSLRAEVARANPDGLRVRRLRAEVDRLWVLVTRRWYSERPWCGGPEPGRAERVGGPRFVPGPGFGRHLGRMGHGPSRGRFDW